jgi:hypothetical protein
MSLPLWSLVTVAKRSTSKSSASGSTAKQIIHQAGKPLVCSLFPWALWKKSTQRRKVAKAQSCKVGDLAKNFLLS